MKTLKNLLRNPYYWIVVNGFFRDSVYAANHRLYFTSVAIPIIKADLMEYMKNPTEFIHKALSEMHPEMKSFTLFSTSEMGWYTSEEFVETYKVHIQESTYRVNLFNKDIPMKPVDVTYRTFHEGFNIPMETIAGYTRRYVQILLESYIKMDIIINQVDTEIWA